MIFKMRLEMYKKTFQLFPNSFYRKYILLRELSKHQHRYQDNHSNLYQTFYTCRTWDHDYSSFSPLQQRKHGHCGTNSSPKVNIHYFLHIFHCLPFCWSRNHYASVVYKSIESCQRRFNHVDYYDNMGYWSEQKFN